MLTKDDLQKFCGTPDMESFGLDKPWSRNIYTFAGNGHYLIRVDRINDVPENPKAPNSFELWPKEIPPVVDIPELPEPELIPCSECKGTGKISVCPECDGSGTVSFENDYNSYECYCESCNGTGKTKDKNQLCEKCNGVGKIPLIKKIQVGNCFFNDRYLILIKGLPNLKFFPHETNNNRIKPAYFSFDGGDGVLMPMLPDGSCKI